MVYNISSISIKQNEIITCGVGVDAADIHVLVQFGICTSFQASDDLLDAVRSTWNGRFPRVCHSPACRLERKLSPDGISFVCELVVVDVLKI